MTLQTRAAEPERPIALTPDFSGMPDDLQSCQILGYVAL